jgi:hypothetical protein
VNGSAGSAGHYPLWSDEPVRRNVDQLEALIFIANQEATVLSKVAQLCGMPVMA